MSNKERKQPNLGDQIFVWPALRTVRDDTRKPVLDENQQPQKKPAHVRNAHGALITRRTFVTVDLHYIRLINSHKLEWCDREENRKHVRTKTKEHTAKLAAEKAEAAIAQPKKLRGAKKLAAATADNTAQS